MRSSNPILGLMIVVFLWGKEGSGAEVGDDDA